MRRRRAASNVWAREPLRLHDAALDARQGRPAHAIGRPTPRSCSTRCTGRTAATRRCPTCRSRGTGDRDVKGLRIGYVEREFASAGRPSRSVSRRPARSPLYEAAMKIYRDAGATLVPITLPDLPAAAIYAILNAEAGAMFDELVRSGAHQRARRQGSQRTRQSAPRDALHPGRRLHPRAARAHAARAADERAVRDASTCSSRRRQSDSVTTTNLTGHPGHGAAGRVRRRTAGRAHGDRKAVGRGDVLRVAAAFESATDWHASIRNVASRFRLSGAQVPGDPQYRRHAVERSFDVGWILRRSVTLRSQRTKADQARQPGPSPGCTLTPDVYSTCTTDRMLRWRGDHLG